MSSWFTVTWFKTQLNRQPYTGNVTDYVDIQCCLPLTTDSDGIWGPQHQVSSGTVCVSTCSVFSNGRSSCDDSIDCLFKRLKGPTFNQLLVPMRGLLPCTKAGIVLFYELLGDLQCHVVWQWNMQQSNMVLSPLLLCWEATIRSHIANIILTENYISLIICSYTNKESSH